MDVFELHLLRNENAIKKQAGGKRRGSAFCMDSVHHVGVRFFSQRALLQL
jgi:hypothetical protein